MVKTALEPSLKTMLDTQINSVSYNHPLNEKIRVFLRVEHLWQEITCLIQQENDTTCLICLQNILNLLDIIERFDLRSDAIKYLDRLIEKFYKIHPHRRLHLLRYSLLILLIQIA